ncbi:MAG TPA: serine hydrolase domain-containing protein [Gemmatimonadales bacterium]|nr:serine hydrolase domain-containing protein [Gemmatimonadales bacterium]
MAYPHEVVATMRRALLISGLVFAAPLIAAQSLPVRWPAAVAEFRRHAATDSTVGAALALVQGGQIIAEEYHGFADRSKAVPANRETIWHWGSITKTLTAVSLMQLVERGRISLDQPAVDLVPELRRIHNPYGPMSDVTVRMLLSHSSGLQAGTWPWSRGEDWEPFEPTEWSQLVAMMPYMRLGFAPGARYSYSNPGIVYLARMIEAKSGDPWQGYIHKNIFLPLQLESSYFGNTPWHLAERRSHNYAVTREGVVDRGADFDPGITIPNGGWNASVQDIAGWMGYLAGSSDPARRKLYDTILPRSVLERMWQPVVRVDDEEQMGLSFFLRNADGHRLIGHTGTQANFRSFFWLDPETGLGIIGVVNTSSDVDGRASTARFNALMAAARAVL